MPLLISRKVFLVVAGGNASAQRHFEGTIQRRRTLEEVRRFLPSREIENLEKIYHGSNFIVWGAVPGPTNETRWEKMAPGDVVLIYNNGRIRFAGADRREKKRSSYRVGSRELPESGKLGLRSIRISAVLCDAVCPPSATALTGRRASPAILLPSVWAR